MRIGVAGAGVFGGYHAAKVRNLSTAELSAIFDIDPARAQALAKRSGTSAHSDYASFLDDCDAVVVAVPAVFHFDLARYALLADRHVLVEKPITTSLAEADELIRVAQRRGLILQTGHQERYVALAAGMFSRRRAPRKIDCIRRTPASGRCEDVSVVLDLMIHDLDLVRTLTTSEPTAISASGDDHDLSAELTFSDGMLCSFESSRRAERPERRMTLVYDDGIVEFDFISREVSNSTPDPISMAAGDDAPLAFRDPLASGAEAFASAILSGEPPLVDGAAGRASLEWALCIEKAAAIGAAAQSSARRRA